MDFRDAAFLEPLSCVVHGLGLLPSLSGKVAILGSGPIGLLHLQAVKGLEASSHITVFDPHHEKLEKAASLGADEVVPASSDVWDRYSGRFDLVIESVGRVEAWEKAVHLVDKGGTVLFFGGCPKDTKLMLDTYKTHYGELRLYGSFHHTPRDVKKALEMIVSGRLRLREILSHEERLDRIVEAYQMLNRGEAVKIHIRP